MSYEGGLAIFVYESFMASTKNGHVCNDFAAQITIDAHTCGEPHIPI